MSKERKMPQPGLHGAAGQARVRVRYAETDQMGVVYHANYFVWFEVGRVELMRQRGLDYKRLEMDEGCWIAVAEATARYKAPARYDDELTVETCVTTVRGPVIRFSYKIIRVADGLLLCEGQTVHVVLGKDMKRQAHPQKICRASQCCCISSAGLKFSNGDGCNECKYRKNCADYRREQGHRP